MNNNLSYGELAELTKLFEEQIAERGLNIDEEQRTEMFMDFVTQYENGNMNPSIAA